MNNDKYLTCWVIAGVLMLLGFGVISDLAPHMQNTRSVLGLMGGLDLVLCFLYVVLL